MFILFRKFFSFWGPIFSLGFFFAFSGSAGAQNFIRVLISRDLPQIYVKGQELVLQDLKTGHTLFKNKKHASLIIERGAGYSLRVDGQPIVPRALVLSSSQGFWSINGRRYQSKLKIFPGPNRDLWAINELPLEDYLVGLINYEIQSHWPLEAVKAQAVAARTYAVYQKENRSGDLYDLDSGVSDQVYGGIGREDLRSRQAVRETEGELLFYRGRPIFAVYHSCCGGRTESPQSMWPGDFPYLKRVDCNFCMDSPHFLWNYQLDGEQMGKILDILGFSGSRVLSLEILQRNESKRVLQLAIKGGKAWIEISGKEFRRLLGYDQIRSTNFIVKENQGVYSFAGLGWGHGVGLCQWGAKGMAEGGMNYRSILKYYYQTVEFGKILDASK